MSVIGQKLKEVRKSKGYSLGKLGIKSGVDRSYISRVESGTIKSPSAAYVQKMADALGVPITDILGGAWTKLRYWSS